MAQANKLNLKIPVLDTSKLNLNAQQAQMTTREEQEQYRLQGMQDGKVEELINHEKREGNRKNKNKKRKNN